MNKHKIRGVLGALFVWLVLVMGGRALPAFASLAEGCCGGIYYYGTLVCERSLPGTCPPPYIFYDADPPGKQCEESDCPELTPTPTPTRTSTATRTLTKTATVTSTASRTVTLTPTRTVSQTSSPTACSTGTATSTATVTAS